VYSSSIRVLSYILRSVRGVLAFRFLCCIPVYLSRRIYTLILTMSLFLQHKSQPCWTGITFSALLAASSIANALVVPRQINSSQLLNSYDYVIVGGGAAGLTVADRLTEDANVNVLVLEAGVFGEMDFNLHVSFITRVGNISDRFWPGLQSVPQPNLNGRPGEVSVAKQVGGGSSINGMVNMRGSVEDYDRWGALFGSEARAGAADWSWDGMLPFFKKVWELLSPMDLRTFS
jgi:choline dehydrogenase